MNFRAMILEDLPKLLEITNDYKTPRLSQEQFEFSYIKDFSNLKREIYVLEDGKGILAWGRIQIPTDSGYAELTLYPRSGPHKLKAAKTLLEAFEQRCIELELDYCDFGSWNRVGITEVPKQLNYECVTDQINMKLNLASYIASPLDLSEDVEFVTLAEEESPEHLERFFNLLNAIFPSPDPKKPYIVRTKDLEEVFLGKRFPPGVCFIAKKDEAYIGTGSCFFTDPETSVFSHLGVLSSYQRKGIAKTIMHHLVSVSKGKNCSTLVSNRFYAENTPLIELLSSLGFKEKSRFYLFRKKLKSTDHSP
ncbi:MAG: GNAT family N-acetyltransferase [Candidatus Hodarchaeota archaeon]